MYYTYFPSSLGVCSSPCHRCKSCALFALTLSVVAPVSVGKNKSSLRLRRYCTITLQWP